MEEIKRCPYCGEEVLAVAKKCKHCGEWLDKSANDTISTIPDILRSKFSISVGVLAGTVGVIFFSLFNWIKISIYGDYSIKATLFNIASKLNHRNLRYFLDGSEEFTLIRIVSVILVIAMVLSFILLITSLLMKPQIKAKPTLAYSGFGLCVIVVVIFLVAMIYVSVEAEQWILTVFPFLTLAVAIVTMIFAVKRPTKDDFFNAAKEMQQKLKSVSTSTDLILEAESVETNKTPIETLRENNNDKEWEAKWERIQKENKTKINPIPIISIIVLILFLVIFFLIVSCKKNMPKKDMPEKAIPEWVEINGVKWAKRNVDKPGIFVVKPENAGMFYKWNSNTGWSSTDPMINSSGTTWDAFNSTSYSWEKTNNPCPTGWRVPTLEEQQSLIAAGSQWTTENGVIGRIFGSDDKTVFFPAAGCRTSGDGSLYGADYVGYYWSGTPNDTHSGYCIVFSNEYAYASSVIRSYGFSIRCVSESIR